MRLTSHRTLLIILALTLAGCGPAADLIEGRINRVKVDIPPQYDKATAAAGRALHDRLFVADLHADALLWRRTLDQPVKRGHVDLQRLAAGNVALQAFTIVTKAPLERDGCIAADGFDPVGPLLWLQGWPADVRRSLFARATHQIDRLQTLDQVAGDAFRVIDSVDQLDVLTVDASTDAPVAGFLGLEGGHALEGDADNLDRLEAKGLRMFAPTHRFDNELGGSSEGCGVTRETPKGKPLTDLGDTVMRRAFKLNIAVDLAHASPEVLRQSVGLALAAHKPVLVSHTGFFGSHPKRRNMTDEEVKLVVMTNGIVGVGFWKAVVGTLSVDAVANNVVFVRRLLAEPDIGCWMTAAGYDFDPIDHIALGSDFDGAVTVPFDAAGLHQLTAALLARGFTEDQIRRIMGENVRRALRQAWSPGAQTLGRPAAAGQCPIDSLLPDQS